MTGELRVDPAAVAAAGEGLGQAAGQIPSPPAGFVAVNGGEIDAHLVARITGWTYDPAAAGS